MPLYSPIQEGRRRQMALEELEEKKARDGLRAGALKILGLFAAAAIIMLTVLTVYSWSNPAAGVVREYLGYMKDGRIEEVHGILSGSARDYFTNNLKSRDGREASMGRVVSYRLLETSGGRKFGSAEVVVESRAGGRADVNWYRFSAALADGKMRIYKVEEIKPVLKVSKSLFHFQTDTRELSRVFVNYLGALSGGDWETAESFLAGPALSAQRASKEYLKNSEEKLFAGITEPETELLYSKGKTAVVSLSYKVSDREVTAAVTFYKTGDGWRIVDVSQL